jgi:methylated-DNA-[protein]-cysteine S-methyltransferase
MDEVDYESPIGLLHIEANELGVTAIRFPKEGGCAPGASHSTHSGNRHLEDILAELDSYFTGGSKPFQTPLDPRGTDFQKSVWNELSKLPSGTTATYGAIAERIGNPKASRAVGLANNRNPLPIVVPCHRVIGKNGKLVGYAGELWRKEWLLQHEAAR